MQFTNLAKEKCTGREIKDGGVGAKTRVSVRFKLLPSLAPVMRGKIRTRVGKLGKLRISSLPRGQKLRIARCSTRSVASLLTGQRDAVERKAGAWALDQGVLICGLGVSPIGSCKKCRRFRFANRTNGDIRVAAQAALFHIAVANVEILENLFQTREVVVRFFGGAEIRIAYDFDKRRTASIEVQVAKLV